MIRLRLTSYRDDQWRRMIHRYAAELRCNAVERPEDCSKRPCDRCGTVYYVNVRIYPPDDGFRCDRCSLWPAYQGSGHRDAYWYAICVNGEDPEGRSETISGRRRRELVEACHDVGLTFGMYEEAA